MGRSGPRRDLAATRGNGLFPVVIGWGMGHLPRLTMSALFLLGALDAVWQEIGFRRFSSDPQRSELR